LHPEVLKCVSTCDNEKPLTEHARKDNAPNLSASQKNNLHANDLKLALPYGARTPFMQLLCNQKIARLCFGRGMPVD